ncbi:DNA-binding transcriptional regulator, XRE-family HTH domain [Lachnospiraceae bacterium]|nr:DNA-binding transcriptional regulator, XRE-family HTH domain [Lachnospiraceae bacterium]
MLKDNVNYELIADRIREMRKLKKISQLKLAEKAELTVQHISNIETCKKGVSLESLIAIANALEVGTDDLLAGNLVYDEDTFNLDIELLWSDCTLYERRVLTKILTAAKDALRSSEGINGDPRNKIFNI